MPTSSASERSAPARRENRTGRHRDRRAGFSMLDVVLALVVLGLLASLGLPFLRPRESETALRAKAFDIVALLRADRNAALRSGIASTVFVDTRRGRIRSERTGSEIVLAPPMRLQVLPPTAKGITFYPNGRALAGEIDLLSRSTSVRIAVSGPSAIVSIREPLRAAR